VSESEEKRFADLTRASKAGDTNALRDALRDPELRWAAAGFLADNSCDEAVPEIARLLDASDDRARRPAIQALGRLGATEHVARISEIARSDGSALNRLWAIDALGRLGGTPEREYLIALLRDPTFDVRRAAVVGLGHLGDPAAAEPVREARRSERRRNPIRYYLLARRAFTETLRAISASKP
jgi:HEAT repeat protein